MVNIGESILESLETKFMNLPPQVFDVDHVVKIRSELSITVLEEEKLLKFLSNFILRTLASFVHFVQNRLLLTLGLGKFLI